MFPHSDNHLEKESNICVGTLIKCVCPCACVCVCVKERERERKKIEK